MEERLPIETDLLVVAVDAGSSGRGLASPPGAADAGENWLDDLLAQGEQAGHRVAASTDWRILGSAGLEIARLRSRPDLAAFDAAFAGADIRIVRTRVRAPRANAIAARFIGIGRRECRDHLLSTGPSHPGAVLQEYLEHFNTHRPNRSPHQHPPAGGPAPPSGATVGSLRRDRLSWVPYTSVCRSHDVTEFLTSRPIRHRFRTVPAHFCGGRRQRACRLAARVPPVVAVSPVGVTSLSEPRRWSDHVWRCVTSGVRTSTLRVNRRYAIRGGARYGGAPQLPAPGAERWT